MKKGIILIFGIVIITLAAVALLVFSFEMFEQSVASNSNEIDHGSIMIKGSGDNAQGMANWDTYQGANNVTVVDHIYVPQEIDFYLYMYIQEVGKNKLKISAKGVDKMHDSDNSATGSYDTSYISTNLTPVQYYWNKVEPSISGKSASGSSSTSGGSTSGSGSGSGYVSGSRGAVNGGSGAGS